MTLKDIYLCFDNVSSKHTRVIFFKHSEEQDYYSDNFDHLSILPTPLCELEDEHFSVKIDKFFVHSLVDGTADAISILLEGETL